VSSECYCEHVNRTTMIHVEDLFDEDKKTKAIDRLMESDRIELYGREYMIVNMSTVTVIEKQENEFIIHFINGNMLIIQNTGRIKFVRQMAK